MNRLTASLVAGTAFVLSIGSNASAAEATTPAVAATSLAHRILTGTSEDASAATAEAFAWAGVSTVDAKRVTVAKAIAPTIPITMKSFEVSKAALAARREPTVTLASLAQLVVDLGAFTPPEVSTGGLEAAGEEMRRLMERSKESGKEITSEDFAKITARGEAESAKMTNGVTDALASGFNPDDTGHVFVDLLGRMIRQSADAPKNPHNFVPLFLEASARERATRDGRTAVDLASGYARPEDVALTLTEAQLFLLMFRRGTTSYAALPVRYASLGMPILAAAPSGTTCSDLVDMMGNFKTVVPHVADFAGGKAMGTAYDMFKEYTGQAISGNAQMVIGYAAKAIRLMTMLMDSSEFEVTPDPSAAHYSHADDKEVEVKFTAEVTIPSSGDAASSEAAVCLNTLFGFNIPDSPQAVAKMMTDWRVYWDFDKMGAHGTVPAAKNNFKYDSPPGNKLVVSGTKGKSELIVNTAHEQPRAELRGKQRKGTMTITASLDKSAGFDPTLIFKSGKAGAGAGAGATVATSALIFADVLADVLIEWAKKVFPPQATASARITWHEPKIFAWEGTISQVTQLNGGRDETMKTEGRAPPAIAIGVSIAAPGPGTEIFHDEGTGEQTMIVNVKGGHEDERIHSYTYKSKDHAKSTSKQKTPEVCMTDGGATWNIGEWTTDFLQTVDSDYEGKGFTKVEVKFEPDGTYVLQTSIPYASGWFTATEKYQGDSSCTGESDPESYPLRKVRQYHSTGPFTIAGHGEAKEDAKELSGSVIETIGADSGPFGTKGTIKTTWKLKRTVVEWTGE